MKTSGKKRTLMLFTAFLIASVLCLEPALQPVNGQDQNQTTTTFVDDFSSDTGEWQYSGSAYRNTSSQNLVLTTQILGEAGVAFFHAPVRGVFTASFRYKAGGGIPGDGFTMFFYKKHYAVSGEDFDGVNLGFSNYTMVPGYGIEFDGWQNIASDFHLVAGSPANQQSDPSASHIALVKDYTGNHSASVDDPRVADNNWHEVSVSVQASSVTVSVDKAVVLQWSGTFDRTYDGFGFSGSNGGTACSDHFIDDFSITSHDLNTPTLTTTCISPQSQSGFNIFKISGSLTFNGADVAGAPIYLSYSTTAGDSWQDLTLLYTDSDGSYSALWLPTVTGNYLLKATYPGTDNYLGVSTTTNFAIQPWTDLNVFSITSNSTLTALAFNSTSNELNFKVSGESGSTGYVDVYVPRSVLNDTSNLKVYLDGNQIEYNTQMQDDCWFLSFTYHHSTHAIILDLGALPTKQQVEANQAFLLDWVQIAILVLMAFIAAAVCVIAVKMLTKKKTL
jgi:hypothetical protein